MSATESLLRAGTRFIPFLALSLCAVLGTEPQAFSFPGMIRHGYVNCTSCHVSPTGGGVLTPYGRQLSGEVLSTWSTEGEGAFIYNALGHPSDDLMLGGDTRVMQLYQSNPFFTEKRFFLMQMDAEGAYRVGKFTFDAEAGYVDSDHFNSLRHYVLFQMDDENALRLGRFKGAYGINTDEHQLTIKQDLGWYEESETYNLEFSRLTDRYSLFATALLGGMQSVDTKRGLTIGEESTHDHGASLRASRYFADRLEVGASLFYGAKEHTPFRTTAGPYVILGFGPSVYYMGELDFQDRSAASPGWGVFDYQRLTYEPVRGLQLFASQELAQPSFGSDLARVLRYGVGAQWFPRPHYEVDLRWNWEQDRYGEATWGSLAWLLLHVYL